MNDMDSLRHRLRMAIARRNEASPFSPEWDAAMSQLDELRTVAREILIARNARQIAIVA
jgi:hypothetical protein